VKPEKRHRYRPPNPMGAEAFNSRGGGEMWLLMVQVWHRLGRLEVAVGIGGVLLLALVGAMAGRVFELF
jgi:hypothetical protein